ncbi:MAG: hypothetical protein PHG85_02300 [Candidatus Altiarchaeota archaeon]|nr:hypothetical protein [Candidatus Altiarchaeota archaeon]
MAGFAGRLAVASLLILVILSSGCLCCPFWKGDGKDGTTTREYRPTTTVKQPLCRSPYIQVGGDCCKDLNSNEICDIDEAATRPSEGGISTSPTVASTRMTTTSAEASTTTTTTTRPQGAKAVCAGKYSVSAGTVIFLYTDSCCKPLLPTVGSVKSKGYNIRYVNMGFPSDSDTKLLSCYYSSLSDIWVPQFICAGTGDSIFITGFEGAGTKITSFAKDCKNSA